MPPSKPQAPKLVVEHLSAILDSCRETFTTHGNKQPNVLFDHKTCKGIAEIKGVKHWHIHCECRCHKKTHKKPSE